MDRRATGWFAAAILGLFVGAAALMLGGQVPIPVMPPQTVFGNISGNAGIGNAIPIQTLAAQFGYGVAANNVVVGRGATATTFGGVAPGTAGRVLLDQGPGVDPAFQVMTGACAINSSGSTSCSAPGVGGTHVINSTTPYSITSGDCGKTVGVLVNGMEQLSLPSPSGFAEGCAIRVANLNQGTVAPFYGVLLNGFPAPINYPLYPTQHFDVQVIGGVWYVTAAPVPWAVAGITFFVDTSGSDNQAVADGLGGGARAFRTIARCANVVQQDTFGSPANPSTCGPTCTQTFQGSITLAGAPGGSANVFEISGQGGAGCMAIMIPTPGAGDTILFGDNFELGLSKINVTCINGSINCTPVFAHQYGVIDINSTVELDSENAEGSLITCDNGTRININNGVTMKAVNNSPGLFTLNAGCTIAANNAFASDGALSAGAPFFRAAGSGAAISLSGNVTFTGVTVGAGVIPYELHSNATLCNLSGAPIPGGGVAVADTGAQYLTANCLY